jgi:hypothetical protein
MSALSNRPVKAFSFADQISDDLPVECCPAIDLLIFVIGKAPSGSGRHCPLRSSPLPFEK